MACVDALRREGCRNVFILDRSVPRTGDTAPKRWPPGLVAVRQADSTLPEGGIPAAPAVKVCLCPRRLVEAQWGLSPEGVLGTGAQREHEAHGVEGTLSTCCVHCDLGESCSNWYSAQQQNVGRKLGVAWGEVSCVPSRGGGQATLGDTWEHPILLREEQQLHRPWECVQQRVQGAQQGTEQAWSGQRVRQGPRG